MLQELLTFLINNGKVAEDSSNGFIDFIPEKPDNLVALMEYAGNAPLPVDVCENRSVQVVIRDENLQKAKERAASIYTLFVDSMDDARKIMLTEDYWAQVYLRQTPFKYKTDLNNRPYYAFNMGITVQVESEV